MDGFKMDDCTIAVTYKCKKKNKNKNSFFKLEDRRKSGRGGPILMIFVIIAGNKDIGKNKTKYILHLLFNF